MRVTIVTAYFAPEISSITHLYENLAADLSAYGADVTVVTNKPNRGLSEAERQSYAARTDERAAAGYRILRVGPDGREGINFMKRGLHFLSGARSLYRAAKRIDTDVYLLGSMPPFLGLVGALLSKRAATVYILQDIFPDSMLLMGKLSPSSPVTRAFRWMERTSYRRNTRFVTISKDMAETLREKGVDPTRIDVIGNWADTDAVRHVARADNPLFDELGLDRARFYAVYAGALGVLQTPDLLLDAAKLVADEPEIGLLVFGTGGLEQHVRERIETERISNVTLFPLQPAARADAVYSMGDVALVPLVEGATKYAMPSKTWTAMAAGAPLIVTAEAGSVWANMVEEAGCGQVVAPGDASALAGGIRAAYAERETLPARGEKARAYAERALSRREATRRYFEALEAAAQTHVTKDAL